MFWLIKSYDFTSQNAILTTLTKTLTGEILFLLTYGTEAMIPTEIWCLSARVLHFSPQNNKQGLIVNLELLEEPRLIAAIRNEAYRHKATQYHNTRVKKQNLQMIRLGTEEARSHG
jgi:uncharacterized membrane protein YccC